MYLFGASGHAKVIIEILELLNIQVKELYDDNREITELLGYPVVGPLDNSKLSKGPFIISIGNNQTRKAVISKYPVEAASPVIHPSAIVSKRASVGLGTVVMGQAIINADTRVGDHVIINTSASVDHDCRIGDFVHIAPNATICGGVKIGEGTLVGSGAVVAPNVRIGKWATIGAGAVVFRNIDDQEVVVGNPSRRIRTGDKPII